MLPSPASFRDHGARVLRKIRHPKVDIDLPLIVKGYLQPSIRGRSDTIVIFEDPGREYVKFERAVRHAMRRVYLNPALRGGKPLPTIFNFSVIFHGAGEENPVSLHPSLLFERQRLGLEYTDPQRFATLSYPDQCVTAKSRGSNLIKTQLWVAVDIDVNGSPSNSRVLGGEARQDCKDAVLQLMLESAYVPAYSDGVPVSATFVEPWH
ncbi:MAG: hypothetical protein Cons2KO_04570 [Congregibacter sp.]